MKTDKERILKFAQRMGFYVRSYTSPEYICDDARKAGAVESIILGYGQSTSGWSAKHYADLNFELDKKGRIVGFSKDAAKSFVGKKR